jgi:hypothetical protein
MCSFVYVNLLLLVFLLFICRKFHIFKLDQNSLPDLLLIQSKYIGTGFANIDKDYSRYHQVSEDKKKIIGAFNFSIHPDYKYIWFRGGDLNHYKVHFM